MARGRRLEISSETLFAKSSKIQDSGDFVECRYSVSSIVFVAIFCMSRDTFRKLVERKKLDFVPTVKGRIN